MTNYLTRPPGRGQSYKPSDAATHMRAGVRRWLLSGDPPVDRDERRICFAQMVDTGIAYKRQGGGTVMTAWGKAVRKALRNQGTVS